MSNTPMTPDQDPNVELDVKKQKDKNLKPSIDWSGGWWSDLKNIYAGGPEYAPGQLSAGAYGGFGPIGSSVPDQKAFAAEKKTEAIANAKTNEWQPAATEEQENERVQTKVQEFVNQGIDNSGIDTSWRKINGIAPGASQQDLEQLGVYNAAKKQANGNPLFVGSVYIPKGRYNKTDIYKGLGLTDENNFLARREYDSATSGGTDVRNELMLLGTTQGATLSVLKELKRTGFYPENTPISNMALNNSGFGAQDEAAMGRFLDFSNNSLRTWQAMMPILTGMTTVSQGGGVKYKGPSTDEVAAYLQEASLTYTGEKITMEKLKKMVTQVQAESRASFNSGTQATSTSVLAEKQIQKSSPAQAASYGLGNAMQLAFRALGGQGG